MTDFPAFGPLEFVSALIIPLLHIPGIPRWPAQHTRQVKSNPLVASLRHRAYKYLYPCALHQEIWYAAQIAEGQNIWLGAKTRPIEATLTSDMLQNIMNFHMIVKMETLIQA